MLTHALHNRSADGRDKAAQKQQQQPQRPRQHSRPFAGHHQPAGGVQHFLTALQDKQQQQKQQQTVGTSEHPISSRAEAHKQQWEGEWKKQWEEEEARKKAAEIKAVKAKERALIKKYNITLTK
jgi:hypothetical protein